MSSTDLDTILRAEYKEALEVLEEYDISYEMTKKTIVKLCGAPRGEEEYILCLEDVILLLAVAGMQEKAGRKKRR